MAKNVTVTLTMRNGRVLVFNKEEETLEEKQFVYYGEKFNGLSKDYFGDNYLPLKLREISEPYDRTYTMPAKKFKLYGYQSDTYKFGYINRKFGGEQIKVLVFNNETNATEEQEFENLKTSEIKKECAAMNMIFIKEISRTKVNESYYYMSEESFVIFGDRKIEK